VFVVDASVALAWCFDDQASGTADEVLGRLEHEEAIAPAIWPLEVANGLRTAERRGRLDRGAGDGIRTRDILLGKQTLCQLSYSRSGDGHAA
jgi:predicted nucleic acid-binding protein